MFRMYHISFVLENIIIVYIKTLLAKHTQNFKSLLRYVCKKDAETDFMILAGLFPWLDFDLICIIIWAIDLTYLPSIS